jgi:low affinity Fe/Cu permease
MQLKLDELIKSQQRASNELVGLEDLTDEELDMVQADFQNLRQEVINRHIARHRQKVNPNSGPK